MLPVSRHAEEQVKASSMKRPSRFTKCRGFGLLEILVAMAILGLLLTMLSRAMETLFRAQSSVTIKGDLTALRQSVANRISCSKTLAGLNVATICDGQNNLQLKDRDGVPLTSPLITAGEFTGSGQFGQSEFYLRASCLEGGKSLRVEIARGLGASPTTFAADPILRKPMSFVDSRPLFHSFACTSDLGEHAFQYVASPWQAINENAVGPSTAPGYGDPIPGPHVLLGSQTITLSEAGSLVINAYINVNPSGGMSAVFYGGIFVDGVLLGTNRTGITGCNAIGSNIPLIARSQDLTPGQHLVEYKVLEFTSAADPYPGCIPPGNREASFSLAGVTIAPNELLVRQ